MLLNDWDELRGGDDFAAPDQFITDNDQRRRDQAILLRFVAHHIQFDHFNLTRELCGGVLGMFLRALAVGARRRCPKNFDL